MWLAYFEFNCVSLFLPKPQTKKALGRVPPRGPTPSFAHCSDSSMIVVELCSYLLQYVFLLYDIGVYLFFLLIRFLFDIMWNYFSL